MKTLKYIILTALAMAAVSASAQEGKNKVLIDVKLGSFPALKIDSNKSGGFGVGAGWQHSYNDYFAWDYILGDFNTNFDFDCMAIGLKTGVRGFSPSFMGDKLRGYANFAMGYTLGMIRVRDFDDKKTTSTKSGFGLNFGLGLQVNKKYSVGYSLDYDSAFKIPYHMVKFGFAF